MTPPGAGEPAQPAAPSCAHRCRARAPTCLARGICARPRSLRQRPTSAVLTAGKVPDAASADCWPCAAHVMCAARFLGAESPYRLKCDWMLDSLNSLSANQTVWRSIANLLTVLSQTPVRDAAPRSCAARCATKVQSFVTPAAARPRAKRIGLTTQPRGTGARPCL